MMRYIATAAVLLLASCGAHAFAADLLRHDPNPTTGVANAVVEQANIGQTICKRGWSASVRPPVDYTERLKREQLPAGVPLRLYELDHVLPIEDGGSPTDPHNLRPQYWLGPSGAHAKDHEVEDPVHHAICSGRMTLAQGQAAVIAWVLAHHPYPIVRQGAPQ